MQMDPVEAAKRLTGAINRARNEVKQRPFTAKRKGTDKNLAALELAHDTLIRVPAYERRLERLMFLESEILGLRNAKMPLCEVERIIEQYEITAPAPATEF